MHQAAFEIDEEKNQEHLDLSEDDHILLYADTEQIADHLNPQADLLQRHIHMLQVADT